MATFNPNQAVGPDGKPIDLRQPTTPPPKAPPPSPSPLDGKGNWGRASSAPSGPAQWAEGVRPPAAPPTGTGAAGASPSLRNTMSWANSAADKAGKVYNSLLGPQVTEGLRAAAATPLGKLVRTGGTVFGAGMAVKDGIDAKARFEAGDAVGGTDSAIRAGAGALMTQPFLPGKLVGAAAYGGNAIGNGITSVANKTETGQGVLDWIGSKFNLSGPSRDQLDEVNRRIAAGQPLGDLVKYAGSSGADYEAAITAKNNGARLPPPNVPAPQGEMGPRPNPNQANNDAKLAAASKLDPSNVVVRQGNSFSGNNIREGFAYGGDGANWERSGVGVSYPIGPGAGSSGVGAAPSIAPPPQGIAPRYTGPMTLSQEANERFNNSPSYSVNFSGTPRQQAAAAKAQEERNAQIMKAGSDRDLMGLREAGDDRRATLRAGVDSRGQDITMRGQDLDAGVRQYAADSAYKSALLKSRSESADKEWDRRFKLMERSDKLDAQGIEQRAAREKSVQSLLEGMYTTQGDNGPVVDTNAVAQSMQALHRSAARAGVNGLHELQPRAMQELLTANKLLTRLRNDSSGIFGAIFGPKDVGTIDPIDLTNMQRLKNGDVMLRSDNPKVNNKVIPARYFQTEEAHRLTLGGMRGTPTSEYDILIGN